jgi:mono/diheme cytochrome c family protein
MRSYFRRLAIVPTLVTFAVLTMSAERGFTDEEADYVVQDGHYVDQRTMIGWRVFHLSCHTCHGVDAVGTDIAPSLVESLKTMSREEFATKVATKYRITMDWGAVSGDDQTALRAAMLAEVEKHERGARGELVMPAWQYSPAVKPHILDIYGYLKARADGVLEPGKPELIKE